MQKSNQKERFPTKKNVHRRNKSIKKRNNDDEVKLDSEMESKSEGVRSSLNFLVG